MVIDLTVIRHDNLMKTLPCVCGGTQVEDRNCIAGYVQFKCCRCKRVEPYDTKSRRAILRMWLEDKVRTQEE